MLFNINYKREAGRLKMKKWQEPEISNLKFNETKTQSDYITICNWNGNMTFGVGNGDYTDPNNKPEQHPNWVWCQVHSRWHPKDHSKDEELGQS